MMCFKQVRIRWLLLRVVGQDQISSHHHRIWKPRQRSLRSSRQIDGLNATHAAMAVGEFQEDGVNFHRSFAVDPDITAPEHSIQNSYQSW